MKVTTAGVLRRIDLTPAIGLLPALFQQWNDLQFDHTGHLAEAPTGSAVSQLVLVEGRHREPGSRYKVLADKPVVATLALDDQRGIAATISDESRRWTVDIEIGRERLPTIDVSVRVGLAASTPTDATPGRLDRFLGNRGEGRASIDLGTIESSGGKLLDARGRMNRFRGTAHAEVDTDPASWNVNGAGAVKGRGLGRVVMLLAGRRMRRHFDDQLQKFWQTSAARMTRAEDGLRELAISVQREGGETAFVHRMLWDPDFDARPDQ